MQTTIKGKTWKFGHNLSNDTDVMDIFYIREHLTSKATLEEITPHVMEKVNPEFTKNVKKGDFVVAGKNFGHGKSHIEGIAALKILHIGAVIVESTGQFMWDTHINQGMPLLICEGISEKINQDDELEVNAGTGEIKNITTGETIKATPAVPVGHPLYPMLEAGGQIAYIRNKVAAMKNG